MELSKERRTRISKEKVTPEHLYTPTDVKRVRDSLAKEQKDIDPILKEPFKETKVCDHDHLTQNVRAALNRNTNAFEGKVYNAWIRCLKWLSDKPLPEILRNLADYYEQDYSKNPLHPGWLKRLSIDFSSLNESSKKEVLQYMNQPQGANAAERKKEFKKALMSRSFSFAEIRDLIQEKKG